MNISLFSLLADINYSNLQPCPLGNGLSCLSSGNGTFYIKNILLGPQGIGVAFVGILFAMLVFYGIRLLIESRNENAITETKQAYAQILAGAVLVGGAALIADTFSSGIIVNESPFSDVANNIISFLTGLIATLVLVNVVIQGIRLIVAQEDGDIDSAKKRFIHGTIGAAIAILATAFVNTFSNAQTGVAIQEIIGIGQYLTYILGALAVLGIMVAGVMLVVSVDEALKDRAKKLILTSLVTLAISMTAYGIVELFVNAPVIS
ncbi:MAG: hypothetical protein KAS32_12830 [Candidatus Peribacteraceae bacterium]|nr:hypothetical protein [Candidatus Peribacteraceae bacterium]